ncbi:keratin, type I cytoskeletal 9 [Halyomorpha halys]|uniref:keratin, type I cytoskeletal 9 n=1 Tax=Halyomorpha halys TaxID=286706 RepID=UPI0006D5268D|nr:keratin, type I cytoskeletal 9-like [Halyomorpha halys]
MDGDGGFSSSGGDGGFSNSSGDGGFGSSGGDGGFGSSGGDGGFGSSGGGFGSSGGADYSNDSKCYSIDQGEDNQTKWNQGPFITSCDEPDKAYIMDDGDNDKTHGLSYIYPALAAASFTKDTLPNENGEAPMSLLLADSADLEEQADGTGDGTGCGTVDFLYYSLVCCCTIM